MEMSNTDKALLSMKEGTDMIFQINYFNNNEKIHSGTFKIKRID